MTVPIVARTIRQLRKAALLPVRLARTGRFPPTPSDAGAVEKRIAQSAAVLERILDENILPFWRGRVIDQANGGYHLNHDASGRNLGPAPKHIIAQTRTLWFFSRVHASRWGCDADAEAARHGFVYLRDHMWDQENGGFFWRVDSRGKPLAPHKHALAQCYSIYALASFAHSFDDREALELATTTFELYDAKAHDHIHGGYREMHRRDWSDPKGLKGYWAHDPCLKLLDTHLHLLEALAALYAGNPSDLLEQRIRELLFILTTADAAEPQGVTRFSRDWIPQPKTRVEYGFDMKRIWMSEAAATVVGLMDESLSALNSELFDQAIKLGWDLRDGGLFNGGLPKQRANELIKTWWTEAEALVASLWLWRRTNDPRHGGIYLATLDWIRDHQVDWQNGDWHETVDHRGRAYGRKAWDWKGPYHVSRAMFECLQMIEDFEVS